MIYTQASLGENECKEGIKNCNALKQLRFFVDDYDNHRLYRRADYISNFAEKMEGKFDEFNGYLQHFRKYHNTPDQLDQIMKYWENKGVTCHFLDENSKTTLFPKSNCGCNYIDEHMKDPSDRKDIDDGRDLCDNNCDAKETFWKQQMNTLHILIFHQMDMEFKKKSVQQRSMHINITITNINSSRKVIDSEALHKLLAQRTIRSTLDLGGISSLALNTPNQINTIGFDTEFVATFQDMIGLQMNTDTYHKSVWKFIREDEGYDTEAMAMDVEKYVEKDSNILQMWHKAEANRVAIQTKERNDKQKNNEEKINEDLQDDIDDKKKPKQEIKMHLMPDWVRWLLSKKCMLLQFLFAFICLNKSFISSTIISIMSDCFI